MHEICIFALNHEIQRSTNFVKYEKYIKLLCMRYMICICKMKQYLYLGKRFYTKSSFFKCFKVDRSAK